jgi:hypothetical protein
MRYAKMDIKMDKDLRKFWLRGHLRGNWYKIVPDDQGNGHLPDSTKL